MVDFAGRGMEQFFSVFYPTKCRGRILFYIVYLENRLRTKKNYWLVVPSKNLLWAILEFGNVILIAALRLRQFLQIIFALLWVSENYFQNFSKAKILRRLWEKSLGHFLKICFSFQIKFWNKSLQKPFCSKKRPRFSRTKKKISYKVWYVCPVYKNLQ